MNALTPDNDLDVAIIIAVFVVLTGAVILVGGALVGIDAVVQWVRRRLRERPRPNPDCGFCRDVDTILGPGSDCTCDDECAALACQAPYRKRPMPEQEKCGHEFVLGDTAYACERKPHPADGYGPEFRHAAPADAELVAGAHLLVTWGEDGNGDGQDWDVTDGALADYGSAGA